MNFFSVDPDVDFIGGADFNLDDRFLFLNGYLLPVYGDNPISASDFTAVVIIFEPIRIHFNRMGTAAGHSTTKDKKKEKERKKFRLFHVSCLEVGCFGVVKVKVNFYRFPDD